MTFKGHSRSPEMSRFDRKHIILYYRSIYGPILYCFPHIARYWSKIAKFIYPICIQHPDPVRISQKILVLGKLE